MEFNFALYCTDLVADSQHSARNVPYGEVASFVTHGKALACRARADYHHERHQTGYPISSLVNTSLRQWCSSRFACIALCVWGDFEVMSPHPKIFHSWHRNTCCLLRLLQVLVFFLFWAMVVYVFALILRQVTEGYGVGGQYFSNVPQSVNNLLLYGIIPDQRDLVDAASTVGAWMWPLIVCFFFFVSITIMYMLVGVLVDVMRVTSATEMLDWAIVLKYPPIFRTILTIPKGVERTACLIVVEFMFGDVWDLGFQFWTCSNFEKFPHFSGKRALQFHTWQVNFERRWNSWAAIRMSLSHSLSSRSCSWNLKLLWFYLEKELMSLPLWTVWIWSMKMSASGS